MVTTKKSGFGVPGKFQLIARTTLTGTATIVTFSGLDMSEDKIYKLFIATEEATDAGDSNLSLFFNGDTTQTNYFNQFIEAIDTTITGARQNNASVVKIFNNHGAFGELTITKDPTGNVRTLSLSSSSQPTSLRLLNRFHIWNDTANVTSITISSATASALKAGSVFTLYKVV